jgi:hypothetical protein
MRRLLAIALAAGMTVPALAAQGTAGSRQRLSQAQSPPETQNPPEVPAGRRAREGRPADPPGLRLDEVQQIVDGWEIATAEKMLELSDQQYVPFLQQLRRLQSGRRQQFMQRQRMLQMLRQTINQTGLEDAMVDSRVKQFDDLERKLQQDLQSMQAGIDAVLTPRQRARFRVLQEQMERRKLEVLARAMRAGG